MLGKSDFTLGVSELRFGDSPASTPSVTLFPQVRVHTRYIHEGKLEGLLGQELAAVCHSQPFSRLRGTDGQ